MFEHDQHHNIIIDFVIYFLITILIDIGGYTQ